MSELEFMVEAEVAHGAGRGLSLGLQSMMIDPLEGLAQAFLGKIRDMQKPVARHYVSRKSWKRCRVIKTGGRKHEYTPISRLEPSGPLISPPTTFTQDWNHSCSANEG
jgi:hypothetical protein